MPLLRRSLILVAWAVLATIAYQASLKHEVTVPDFDPFKIFGIDPADYPDFESSKKPIKKINRELSKTMHPDARRNLWLRENPDAEGIPDEILEEFNAEWTEIVRAYKTLTDEVIIVNL